MKAKVAFHTRADVGAMTDRELRAWIERAEELGKEDCVQRGKDERNSRKFDTGIDAASASLRADVGRSFDKVFSERGTRATRAENMVKRKGVLGTVATIVSSERESQTYAFLKQRGLEKQYSFEAVVLRHRSEFEPKVIAEAERKLFSN